MLIINFMSELDITDYLCYLELILSNRGTTLSVLLLKFWLIQLQHSDLSPSIEE